MTQIPVFLSTSMLAEAAAQTNPFGNQFIMMGLMVVMFYFLLIRPQQKQRKEQAARIAALAAGDKVVTSAGIHGLVHNVKEHTVVIKVAEGTMIEFDKGAVSIVHKKESSAK